MQIRTLQILDNEKPSRIIDVIDVSFVSIQGTYIEILFKSGVKQSWDVKSKQDAQNIIEAIYNLRTKT